MDENEQKGLFEKYDVRHANGDKSPDADYFVLRLDKDRPARVAALAYAQAIWNDNERLARDLIIKVNEYDRPLVARFLKAVLAEFVQLVELEIAEDAD